MDTTNGGTVPRGLRDPGVTGVVSILGAFVIWGMSPIYFRLLDAVSPIEIVAHRVVWVLIFIAGLLTVTRGWAEFRAAFRDRQVLAALLASTVLITVNWLTYVWAIAHDQLLQSSLGYYINPLVSVILGVLFLGERLNRVQMLAVGLAAAAVLILAWEGDGVPWIALVLAVSFGFYGLVRKTVRVESTVGLGVETLLILPVALGYLIWIGLAGEGSFRAIDLGTDLLLIGLGLITAAPLLFFTIGARRLPLITVGLIQYVSPTLQAVIAIFLWNEPFTHVDGIAFALIWTALALYSGDGLRRRRRRLPAPAATGQ
ncbi:EamA family transporter RarD [Oceanibacterium hippocampi]|uniref:EamA-like transporter family protein n=1 Tax=Oceanibacterium hippocampi TaxID=745714 RepID=A0A1Y5RIL1_9PROT|nr:EamA family transporter RarD [Oceanibacterium hippocampi]SLN18117.1 EamA-like transporter family protein [Oceanibacterium hippocampi]